jgi:hypothetical protein
MKLNLLFAIMDLLTLLAYPIIFMYGKVKLFSSSKENVAFANFLVVVPVRSDEQLVNVNNG